MFKVACASITSPDLYSASHHPLTPLTPLSPLYLAALHPVLTLLSNLSQAPPNPSLSPLFDTLRVAGELPSVFHLPFSHLSHSLPADPPTQRVLTIQTRGARSSGSALRGHGTTASKQQGALSSATLLGQNSALFAL